MSIKIGAFQKVDAVRHDGNDVVRFRRELRNAGVDEQHHERVLAAARAANVLNDQPDVGDVRDGMHAGAGDKQTVLARLDASLASTEPAIRSTAEMLQGLLKRGGVARTDLDDVSKLDKIFAASRLSTTDKLVCKNLLFRLGAIA